MEHAMRRVRQQQVFSGITQISLMENKQVLCVRARAGSTHAFR